MAHVIKRQFHFWTNKSIIDKKKTMTGISIIVEYFDHIDIVGLSTKVILDLLTVVKKMCKVGQFLAL